jgi:hypothetical protein
MKPFSSIRIIVCILIVFVAGSILYGGCGQDASQDDTSPFTIILMPDTQNYTDSSFGAIPQYFFDQTKWIRDAADSLNIRMVAHLGDIVQNPRERSQWSLADSAFATIDASIPYILCLGNHDITGTSNSGNEERTSLVDDFFPPSRFTGNPIYDNNLGGNPEAHFMEPGKSDNYYLYFSGGGMDFLIIAIEFQPRDKTLDWANEVVATHPDHRCIVVTHAYLNAESKREISYYEIGGNGSSEIWDKFVKKHDNMFMVLCGHILGEAMLVSNGENGNEVYQILADYQNNYIGNGGNGYLRIMTFYPKRKVIENKTYSPTLGTFLTRPKSEFTINYMLTADSE